MKYIEESQIDFDSDEFKSAMCEEINKNMEQAINWLFNNASIYFEESAVGHIMFVLGDVELEDGEDEPPTLCIDLSELVDMTIITNNGREYREALAGELERLAGLLRKEPSAGWGSMSLDDELVNDGFYNKKD